jgi:hypothetical protein
MDEDLATFRKEYGLDLKAICLQGLAALLVWGQHGCGRAVN